jgi:hypothetical protein
MNDTSANPIFVALLFILRCVVPLAILFGISYLLRKMGLVAVEAPEPPDERDANGGKGVSVSPNGAETIQPKPPEKNTKKKKTVETSRSRSK